jgi:hypothetical protein
MSISYSDELGDTLIKKEFDGIPPVLAKGSQSLHDLAGVRCIKLVVYGDAQSKERYERKEECHGDDLYPQHLIVI